jgi:hypothetical protein
VGAEIFGDIMAKGKGEQTAAADADEAPEQQPSSSSSVATAPAGVKSVDQVLESIRADYAEDYFISGKGEMADYDPECLFADPFVSFRGVDRFKKNVSNLGALMCVCVRGLLFLWGGTPAVVLYWPTATAMIAAAATTTTGLLLA